MFINGVKVTLIICLTILVSAVLLISYNEYTNRYTITPTSDNGIYIFDKKSSVLNKCSEKGCEVIETKLQENAVLNLGQFSPSKMFSAGKNMRDAIVKTEATEKNDTQEKDLKLPESAENKTEEKKESDNKVSNKQEKSEKKADDEFIE